MYLFMKKYHLQLFTHYILFLRIKKPPLEFYLHGTVQNVCIQIKAHCVCLLKYLNVISSYQSSLFSKAPLVIYCILLEFSCHACHLRFPSNLILRVFFRMFSFPASNLFSSSISVFIPLYMPFCFFLSLFYSFFLPPVLSLPVFLSEQAFLTLVFSLSPWFPFSHPHWNVGRNIFFFENKETK